MVGLRLGLQRLGDFEQLTREHGVLTYLRTSLASGRARGEQHDAEVDQRERENRADRAHDALGELGAREGDDEQPGELGLGLGLGLGIAARAHASRSAGSAERQA